MPQWVGPWRSDVFFDALGIDADYQGMYVDSGALPVLPIEAQLSLPPVYASAFGRDSIGPFAGGRSVLRVAAPRAYGMWLELSLDTPNDVYFTVDPGDPIVALVTVAVTFTVLVKSNTVDTIFDAGVSNGSAPAGPPYPDTLCGWFSSAIPLRPIWIPPTCKFYAWTKANNQTFAFGLRLSIPDALVVVS